MTVKMSTKWQWKCWQNDSKNVYKMTVKMSTKW
jgi:hypothetical protein